MKSKYKIAAFIFALIPYLIIINIINPGDDTEESNEEVIRYLVDEKYSENSKYKAGIFVIDNKSFGYSDYVGAVVPADQDYTDEGEIYCNIIEKIEWEGDSLLLMIDTRGDTCRWNAGQFSEKAQ